MGCNDLGAYGMVAKNAAPALRLLFLLAGLELAGLPAIRSINSWLLIFFCMAGFDLWQLHGVADGGLQVDCREIRSPSAIGGGSNLGDFLDQRDETVLQTKQCYSSPLVFGGTPRPLPCERRDTFG